MQIQVVILAAGHGTRMKSDLPKVLHQLGGRPVLDYVFDVAHQVTSEETILVVGPSWKPYPSSFSHKTSLQPEARGTGDAVRCALPLLTEAGYVLILYGDTPLMRLETLQKMLDLAVSDPHMAVVVVGIPLEDGEGYARLALNSNGDVEKIIEYKDAHETERALPLSNAGIMLVRGDKLKAFLENLTPNNAAQEYYLTDLVAIANTEGFRCGVVEGSPTEFMGINTRQELAQAESILQEMWRQKACDQGVTLIDPKTVYLSYDTCFQEDITLHPFVVIGPSVVVEKGAEIFSFSHLDQTHIGPYSKIGPFARLRDGVVLHEKAEVGNFVEAKKSTFGALAKAKHLAYLGDTNVGEKTNIGAGTITCNYDGFQKFKTCIGAEVAIGSNCSLIAPLTIGDRAIIGAGSVLTEDVEPDALVLARAPQTNHKQGAQKFRQKRQRKES